MRTIIILFTQKINPSIDEYQARTKKPASAGFFNLFRKPND